MTKDYNLLGETGRQAEQLGLASPKWFRADVDPSAIRSLMKKSDARAAFDTALWIGSMAAFGGVAIALWPSWWSLPFWAVYGVLYGSGGDSRWHECGHNTAFKTVWMNTAVYQFACFLMVRPPVVWKSSHIRHHTDTIIVGRDPEIVAMRPPDLVRLLLNVFGLVDLWTAIPRMFLHASGRLDPQEATYVRPEDANKVFRTARIWIVIYLAVIALAVWFGTILPLMVVGLPRLYGAWHHVMTGLLQHLGLAENVTDHRLNTRTVMMNPFSRFIYLNMNYHIEHHMFTMVPYYNLPKLHALIAKDCPAPDPSIVSAYRRLLPVLWRQLQDEDAVIIPKLPNGAQPFGPEVEHLRPHAV